ncbi:Qat anti-phage system associated protein QatB, partial [Henriciella sp.]|uniref:Qat anti-phage system associated protein QatB n=1 Tax=Henriciella sp. TaxID=1968823 RepID=UPI0025BD2000
FRSARSNFTRFAGSGGSDRRSLGRAVSQYVSRSSGGAGSAARRMGSSRSTASGLVSFLGDARANGVREALRSLNLEGLAGRPVEEVFAGLADYICPDGGSIDEGIARDAFIETIADLAEAGITDIDGLTSDQIQTVFELYASHTIEARICNDIGTRVVTMPSDARTVERIEAQLSEFIQRGVSDAVNASGIDIGALSQDQVSGFVDDVYEAAFAMLEALGESEAEA